MRNKKHELYYHAMLFPGIVFLIIFSIIPMFGIIMAFQKFMPIKGILGSEFVGLNNFKMLLMYPDVKQIILNTVIIATSKIVLGIVVPVFFAILLNELRSIVLKRTIQTIVYLPHFLSWVILAVMFTNILSYTGMVNKVLQFFGIEPIMFMISNNWFRIIIIATDVWKGFGYGAVIYIAAMTNIDPNLYEAAEIDGANRWHKIRYVTLPSITPTIILMSTLALGNVLNAGFEQIFTMYSPLVYETGDIIDTYVYRMGLEKMQYSFATAVGLFKSVISFILIVTSYRLADKYAGYTIF
jgi:putative aldouronate transport system permease protein